MGLIDRLITTFTKPVSALPDKPSITATQVKEWFDQSPLELKSQTNGIITDLIATVDGADGAGQIGAGPVFTGDVSSATVIGKLKYLYTQLINVVLGQVPDGSITDIKLAEPPVKALTGSDTFPLGETSYVVTNAFITLDTWVDVSPDLTNKQGTWTVVSANGYFTITSDATETSDIDFDWRATK